MAVHGKPEQPDPGHDRLGRGYSFEALRAKILFAEGTLKRTNSRPKFERRVRPAELKEVLEYGFPGDAVAMTDLIVVEPPEKKRREKSGSTHAPKNYGVDISTRAQLIEEGQI
ncbi:hypothetical protein [Burkholderia gladioli]|uniref:hypothetical protein n=1 Tax=Burkholderia gladioli TaxID=28095 RepID=UPI002152F5F9|nr:hypothetical protein [Burkholderia gladioli]